MKILMIGNSATYYHDVPKTLEALIAENGTDIKIDSVTKGGRKLCENFNPNDSCHQKIAELCRANKYDVLFLQEHTMLPLFSEKLFTDSAKKLTELVGADKTVLYATPPRKEGASDLAKYNLTVHAMVSGIHRAYENAASVCNAVISPVSMCFYNAMESHPWLNLHADDLAHTSYTGSCLVALTHYKSIFGHTPKSASSLETDEETTKILIDTVNKTF